MTNQITLSSTDTTLSILTWNEQPVITFAMIDEAHQREAGTASRNFRKNRKHFIEGEDYFHLTHKELNQLDEFRRVKKSSYGMIILTLAGYTMLTKSLTDDLAWQVQRELVNSYFKPLQTSLEQRKPTMHEIRNSPVSIRKVTIEFAYTPQGEVIYANELTSQSPLKTDHKEQESTASNKPQWIEIIEIFFDEIDQKGIPEDMRQNMLISKEVITSATDEPERHDCLFFRPSNLMAFLRKEPRFFDLMNASPIHTTQTLLAQLNKAGVLAFGEKTKEKGIPMNPSVPSDTRRVPHLVAIDLVVLEHDYGIVMPINRGIARAFH